jgi:hypothetical protein
MRSAQDLVKEQFAVIETGDLTLADTDMAKQVDWIPLRPSYVLRMLIALRRARRAA